MQNHTGCICLTFLHCAFSNVSSKRLAERMHNHTGCICLIFLHCAFSNVSSKGLHERMHNHTGCICLTFLHCAFSNVSSKHLHKRLHSRIGCICLTFRHCVFSNVSLNCLPKRMHNHIGCIYLASYQFLSLLQDLPHCHSFQEFSPSQNLDLSTTDVSRDTQKDTQTGSDMLRVLVFQFNKIIYFIGHVKGKVFVILIFLIKSFSCQNRSLLWNIEVYSTTFRIFPKGKGFLPVLQPSCWFNMYQQSLGKAKYLCSFVQRLFDSQCIENTNPSVGSKCIGGSSQPPFAGRSKPVRGLQGNQDLRMRSKDPISGNRCPTETSFYEIPIEFPRLDLQFEFCLGKDPFSIW